MPRSGIWFGAPAFGCAAVVALAGCSSSGPASGATGPVSHSSGATVMGPVAQLLVVADGMASTSEATAVAADAKSPDVVAAVVRMLRVSVSVDDLTRRISPLSDPYGHVLLSVTGDDAAQIANADAQALIAYEHAKRPSDVIRVTRPAHA